MEAENSAAKSKLISLLRKSEKYTKTDMVYLLKGGFWLNLNNVISSGLSFVLSILFAKYVSKEAYGSYQFLISFASINWRKKTFR
jgi:short subunit fatty acids transporter